MGPQNERDWITERFEEHRAHLRGVAYRMLGSLTEAEDAVQEAWLRLNRSDAAAVENLGGWLTTVVAHVCFDMLRSRTSRREKSLAEHLPEPAANHSTTADPEQEVLLADSVGLALLVVLDRLTPAERLAFVLHDMFGMSFDEIATIVGRSSAAARQLASRARRRVQGGDAVDADRTQQREIVNAFLAALRGGDFDALVAVLDPDLVVRVDATAARPGGPTEVRGAQNWARQALAYSKGARFAQAALVNGSVGAIVAPGGRLFRALEITIERGRIVRLEVIGDAARLAQLDIAALRD
jgi:RNA polymerase sigma-70 factor (ECF subfamily)